jgi:hypothetical protein
MGYAEVEARGQVHDPAPEASFTHPAHQNRTCGPHIRLFGMMAFLTALLLGRAL